LEPFRHKIHGNFLSNLHIRKREVTQNLHLLLTKKDNKLTQNNKWSVRTLHHMKCFLF
jgi:hypothetical protein